MVMYGGTTIGGCPYCGCTCSSGCTVGGYGNDIFAFTPTEVYRSRRERELEAILINMKRELSRYSAIPGWVVELIATPRRTKRPFPPSIKGPPICHSSSRPRHRRLMRTKRLWRGAHRSRSSSGSICRPQSVRSLMLAGTTS